MLFRFLEEADVACSPVHVVVAVVGFTEWSATVWTSTVSPSKVVAGGGGKDDSAAVAAAIVYC